MSAEGTLRRTRRRRLAAWIAVITCFPLLQACGPGVVGTGSGTGDAGNDSIEYEPGNVCKSDFAGRGLDCAGEGRLPGRGTDAVRWSDADATMSDARVALELEAQRMDLRQPCGNLDFTGQYGLLADGRSGFVGTVVSDAAPEARTVVAVVSAAVSTPTAVGWVQIEDAQGTLLHGPWLVSRVDTEPAFAACTP